MGESAIIPHEVHSLFAELTDDSSLHAMSRFDYHFWGNFLRTDIVY